MKILIDLFGPPFHLAHGGAQTQVHQTVEGLKEIGIEVEYARWWDGKQTGDIIHSFGIPDQIYIEFARAKGIRVVNTTLFTATCNRSALHLALQGTVVSVLDRLPMVPPWSSIRSQLNWGSFGACDLNIVGLNVEADVLRKVYSVPDSKIRTVPLGLSKPFLDPGSRIAGGMDLITTGTITERKRSVELAKMAKSARVPIKFVGKPYAPDDSYWREFESLIDGEFVKHIPHTESVEEMIGLLKESRGYVLYSDYENWCLSAHEALACGLPILIPDQPWSREVFRDHASYFAGRNIETNIAKLREFHGSCPTLKTPDIRLYSWTEVASMLVECYRSVL